MQMLEDESVQSPPPTPRCPSWCSAAPAPIGHDHTTGEHRAEPALVFEPKGDECVSVHLVQRPGDTPRVVISRWPAGNLPAGPSTQVEVPLVAARELIRLVSAAMWAGQGVLMAGRS